MANTLYVIEYANSDSVIGTIGGHNALPLPYLAVQTLAFGGAVGDSPVLNAKTKAVILIADTAGRWNYGEAAVGATDAYIPANVPSPPLAVHPGSSTMKFTARAV